MRLWKIDPPRFGPVFSIISTTVLDTIHPNEKSTSTLTSHLDCKLAGRASLAATRYGRHLQSGKH